MSASEEFRNRITAPQPRLYPSLLLHPLLPPFRSLLLMWSSPSPHCLAEPSSIIQNCILSASPYFLSVLRLLSLSLSPAHPPSLSLSLVCVSPSPFFDILHPALVHLTADAFSTDSPGLDRGLTIALRPVGILHSDPLPLYFPPDILSSVAAALGRPMVRV